MCKYYIYWISVLLAIIISPFSIGAKTIDYESLSDSAKLQIRLKSFLTIHPEYENSESIFISETEIPVAFIYDSSHRKEFNQFLKVNPLKHTPIVVISDVELDLRDSINTDIIVCRFDLIDKIRLSGDTLNQTTIDTSFTQNELLLVDINSAVDSCNNYIFKIWARSGNLPNFILANSSNIDTAIRVVNKINSFPIIYGEVREGKQLLSNVYWENSPGVKTYGYFCFPLNNSTYLRLIPYKAGYRFSPDIIQQSASNKDDAKIFHGFKHEPGYGLTDHYTFRKIIKNNLRGVDKSVISNNVEYINDKEKGWVANFKRKSYFDAGLLSKESLKSTFSITAWIYPTQFNHNNSILGKGRNFVLKLNQGNLTFTMAGIKDYISENSPVPLNTWTHIAMVYSKFNNHINFYINGKHTEQIDLIADYEGSDYSLMIGSNLWEEFFVGNIDEIKIWDRELSSDEIEAQYLQIQEWIPRGMGRLVIIVLLGVGMITYLFFKRRTGSKKNKPTLKQLRRTGQNQSIHSGGEQIICFGGLKIYDKNANEIDIKLSPKLKQLFVLIFLKSKEGNGGITSNQMNEILWPGMSTPKAKNIRGTYIQNLKAALSTFENINLVFEDKKWRFDFADQFYNEYLIIEEILSYNDFALIEKQLPHFITILKKGRFLQGMEESWLDPFIEKMDNRIIEFCLACFAQLNHKTFASIIFDLSEIVSLNDPLNETALQKKIQILVDQGKLSLAHNIYDNFVKLYKELYKEEYTIEFKDLLSEDF